MMIYVARSNYGWVKIGHSCDVDGRLREWCCSIGDYTPILKYVRGCRDARRLEKCVHRELGFMARGPYAECYRIPLRRAIETIERVAKRLNYRLHEPTESDFMRRKPPTNHKPTGRPLGRPPTGVTPARSIRLSPAVWAAIDRWRHTRVNNPTLTSSGAVRKLLLIALRREKIEVEP